MFALIFQEIEKVSQLCYCLQIKLLVVIEFKFLKQPDRSCVFYKNLFNITKNE